MVGQACSFRFAKRADCISERNLRIGPMQEQEIDMRQTQSRQAVSGGAFKRTRLEMRWPDLGRDEDLVAVDSGCAQSVPDFVLILVHLGGIDVPIPETQR